MTAKDYLRKRRALERAAKTFYARITEHASDAEMIQKLFVIQRTLNKMRVYALKSPIDENRIKFTIDLYKGGKEAIQYLLKM